MVKVNADLVGPPRQRPGIQNRVSVGSFAHHEPGSGRLADTGFLNLYGSFPSPFTKTTTIRYEVRSRQNLWVSIYDVLGREVVRLPDRAASPGVREAVWDGRSASGDPVSSGLYFIRVETEHMAATGKVTLTR